MEKFGHLDLSFGSLGTGLVTTNFGGNDSANSIAIAPRGKIIVAGYADNVNSNNIITINDENII